jgi:VWFA-related protein
MTRQVPAFIVAGCLAGAATSLVSARATSGPVPAPPAGQPAGTRTVYVSAVDGKDAPVPGMTAADFVVKEDGKVRDIVSADVAKTPMQVVLMLDDSGLALGAIRQGAWQFIQTLQGRAEFAIITISGRNLTLVDFTPDPRVLFGGLQKLLARSTGGGTYLLDGFVEVSQVFQRRKAERPVIVVVATEGEEFSHTRPEVVLDAIQKSTAKLFYIGLGAPVTQGTRPDLSAQRPGDSTENESNNRNAVLGSAPKNSGGRSEQSLQPTSGVPVLLQQFATELAGQYAITYKTDAADARLGVETKRKGVKLRAQSRVSSNK